MAAFALARQPEFDVHLLSATCSDSERRYFLTTGLLPPKPTQIDELECKPIRELTAQQIRKYLQNRNNEFWVSGVRDTVCWHELPFKNDVDSITTIKFRNYKQIANQPPLMQDRLDQDPGIADVIDSALPNTVTGTYDAILVADFAKGAVTPELLECLAKRYPHAIWGIDAKNESLITGLHKSFGATLEHCTVIGNRSETESLARACGLGFSDHAFHGKRGVVWGHILNAGVGLAEKLAPWTVVVKLDEDGAIAFWKDGGVVVCCSSRDKPVGGADGVGAGDFFDAGYVAAELRSQHNPLNAIQHGVSYAAQWLKWCQNEFWESTYHRKAVKVVQEIPWPSQVAWGDTIPDFKDLTKEEVGDASQRIETFNSKTGYDNLVATKSPMIDLTTGRGYLGDFLTVDPNRGQLIRQFTEDIRSYFDSPFLQRPHNAFVWADPGSGKTFFVRELAKILDASFEEINVSQLPAPSRIVDRLEHVAKQRHSRLILFLDEVDMEFGNNVYVYSQLLQPMWDGTVMTPDGIAVLPEKTVIILVASSSPKKEADPRQDFEKALNCNDPGLIASTFLQLVVENKSKGKDLTDRIPPDDGRRIAFTEPSEMDRLYMAASMIRRLFSIRSGKKRKSLVTMVHRGFLRLLVEGKFKPRRIEQILGTIKPPRDGIIDRSDWKDLATSKTLQQHVSDVITLDLPLTPLDWIKDRWDDLEVVQVNDSDERQ